MLTPIPFVRIWFVVWKMFISRGSQQRAFSMLLRGGGLYKHAVVDVQERVQTGHFGIGEVLMTEQSRHVENKDSEPTANRLQAKDLINVGIFTAIYFVVVFAVSLIGFMPTLMPLLAVLVPFIGGIPFMLYLTRVKKFGMVFIMGLVLGILMLVTGMGYWAILTGFAFGLLADLILRSGNYRSARKSILGYGVFSMWVTGNFIPMFVQRESYFSSLATGYGEEYTQALAQVVPEWSLLLFFVGSFVAGILGGLIGKAILKKHFMRAGIA